VYVVCGVCVLCVCRVCVMFVLLVLCVMLCIVCVSLCVWIAVVSNPIPCVLCVRARKRGD
jgi:hypothetical protein